RRWLGHGHGVREEAGLPHERVLAHRHAVRLEDAVVRITEIRERERKVARVEAATLGRGRRDHDDVRVEGLEPRRAAGELGHLLQAEAAGHALGEEQDEIAPALVVLGADLSALSGGEPERWHFLSDSELTHLYASREKRQDQQRVAGPAGGVLYVTA